MVLFGKKKLSEIEVAGQFVLMVFKGVQQQWPKIANDLKSMFQEENFLTDNQYDSYEFALAVIATQIQALPNLLPSEQANRIREYIMQGISSPDLEGYPREAIQEYQNAWDQSIQQVEPPYSISSILFDKLECQSTIEVGGEKFKNPVLLMALFEKIVTFGGPWWKNIIKEYELFP